MEKVLLLLAEAAVELIPEDIRGHPVIVAYCRRRGKDPRWTLLDSSYHYKAMRGLKEPFKRGRPDILHFTLLESLGSPINHAMRLEVFCHTYDDRCIEINPETRLPRVYERFKGLIEKLYREGEIRDGGDKVLLRMHEIELEELISKIKPTKIYLLSELGRRVQAKELEGIIARERRPLFIIGCFPHGEFSDEVTSIAEEVISIAPMRLEAWVAASRLLCAAERAA